MAGRWLPKTLTLSVWALAGLSASYWALRFAGAKALSITVPAPAAATPDSSPADLAKVFGPPIALAPAAVASAPKAIDPSTRFALLGVVAGRSSAGVALISVEGKTARPYRVGSRIDDAYVLKSVAVRSATLAPLSEGGEAVTLELTRTGASAGSTPPGLPPLPPQTLPVPPATAPPATPPLRMPRPPRSAGSAL